MAENHIVEAVPNRWVLLHLHIFKNAGSTIEYVLQRSFGDRFATVHGPCADSVISAAALWSFLESNPRVAALSSHHLRYPLPELPETILFDICFFRHPIRRLWSMYRYFRGSNSGGDLASCAKEQGAATFFDQLLAGHPHLINDVQVNFLANGGIYARPPTAEGLRIALERMPRISVIGTVEQFDESAVAAEYFLRPTFPALRFEYVAQNVSPGEDNFEERFREELGVERCAQLERLNRLDLELMEAVSAETSRRFEMVPDGIARLAEFRHRCELLQVDRETPRARVAGRS